MPLTVGGGVRTVEDIRRLLLAGADKVSINTAAVKNRISCARRPKNSAAQCIVVAIDAKRCRRGRAAPLGDLHPWRTQRHRHRRHRFARKWRSCGAGEILVTSMDRDGTKGGYDLALVRAIADAVSVPVIASGGVGKLDHLVDGVRTAMPARCSPPRSSTSAPTRSRKPRAIWPSKGLKMRLDEPGQSASNRR